MTIPVTPDADRPDYHSGVVKAMAPDVAVVRDVAAGYAAIKAKGETYLPRHPKETRENYAIRLARPTFFNAFTRTLDGLVGMVFRKSPVLGDDVPKPVIGHWENIDKEGNHGDVFLKTLFADAVEAGHCAVLIDYPRIPAGRVTLADEQALDLRPYWVHIRKEDIINFRTRRGAGGERILEQITLRFTSYEADGLFGDKPVVRFRVYRRTAAGIIWETWQLGTDGIPMPLLDEQGTIAKLTEIPVVVIYGRQIGYFQSRPPLLDLAQLNILHYQTNADYFHALHIALVPVPVMTGGIEGSLEVGPNAFLALPAGATFAYVETTGAALATARTALEDLEGQMAVMGLSLLQGEKRAAETAEAKRLDKSEKDSALSTMARALQDGVEEALRFHAQYLGLPDGGSVLVNHDFADEALDPAEIQVLGEAVARGQLSLETMWQKLAEGEWLPEDFDPEVERERLAVAGMVPPVMESGGLRLVASGNPYHVVQRGEQFCVEKKSGERVTCHPTKEAAMAHFRALEANILRQSDVRTDP